MATEDRTTDVLDRDQRNAQLARFANVVAKHRGGRKAHHIYAQIEAQFLRADCLCGWFRWEPC